MIRLTFDGKDFKNNKGMVVVNPEVMEMPTIKIMNMVFGASYNTWDIYRWPYDYTVEEGWPYSDGAIKLLLPSESTKKTTMENSAHGYTEGSESKPEPTKEPCGYCGKPDSRDCFYHSNCPIPKFESKLTASESRVKELETLVGEMVEALEYVLVYGLEEVSFVEKPDLEGLLLKSKALKP